MFKARVIRDSEIDAFGMPTFEDDRARKERERIERERALEEEIERRKKEAYETAYNQGYQEGFASGEKEGFSSGEQKAAPLIEELGVLTTELKSHREEEKNAMSELEPQVFELIMTMVKRVVHEEMIINPDLIARVVKEALRKLEKTGTLTLKINSAIHDLLTKIKPELLEIYPDIRYEVDDETSPKGPLVVGDTQEVDADIEKLVSNVIEDTGIDFANN